MFRILLHPLPCYSASHIYVLFRRSHTRRVTWHEMKENTEGEEGWPPTVLWHIIQDCQWSSLFSNSAQLQPPLNTRQGHIVVQLEVEVWTPHCEWAGRQKGSYFPDISCPPYRDGGWDHVSLTYDSNLIEAEDIKSSLIPILSGYQAISEGFVMWTKASGIILRPLFCTSHHPNISSSNSFGLMIDVDPCTPRLKVRVQCVNMIIDVFIDISVKLWPRSFL